MDIILTPLRLGLSEFNYGFVIFILYICIILPVANFGKEINFCVQYLSHCALTVRTESILWLWAGLSEFISQQDFFALLLCTDRHLSLMFSGY
jgi:hypothetical protein